MNVDIAPPLLDQLWSPSIRNTLVSLLSKMEPLEARTLPVPFQEVVPALLMVRLLRFLLAAPAMLRVAVMPMLVAPVPAKVPPSQSRMPLTVPLSSLKLLAVMKETVTVAPVTRSAPAPPMLMGEEKV